MLMRRVRFGAVLVAVVLALTGFSGKKHGHSSSGGGCSSHKSSTTHHDYDNDDYDNDDYNSTSSGGSTYTDTPTPTPSASAESDSATVLTCVQKAQGKQKPVTRATVKVMARQRTGDVYADTYAYRVRLVFRSATGTVVDRGTGTVNVRFPEGTGMLTLPMDSPSKVSRVARCEVESVERVG
ncbi:hypothetical protein [Streptomyces beijiangensis]|uniref:Uncharacterized protein n=1 Tax=Streptomyces beijiangensis TaxID=163361 RepID=A0A939F3T3_9ACTN|nr:hypothetical protein [Streptomyces beijiangensis]MBO0511582.1 hypothetical protein [Streptomyces beijiangensis]